MEWDSLLHSSIIKKTPTPTAPTSTQESFPPAANLSSACRQSAGRRRWDSILNFDAESSQCFEWIFAAGEVYFDTTAATEVWGWDTCLWDSSVDVTSADWYAVRGDGRSQTSLQLRYGDDCRINQESWLDCSSLFWGWRWWLWWMGGICCLKFL